MRLLEGVVLHGDVRGRLGVAIKGYRLIVALRDD
jgi:hypothetical protein